MPYVLTVDQIQSRHQRDLVAATLKELTRVETVLAFARTVGDEFQGLLEDPMSVLTVILSLMRTSRWHIGVGIGPVTLPLPSDTRSARGPAFVAARSAVDRAKQVASHVSVVASSPAEEEGRDVEALLRLVAAVRERRSDLGWAAIDLVSTGLSITEAAATLQITRQAVGQRLQAAHWVTEAEALPVVARLLHRAESRAAAQVAA